MTNLADSFLVSEGHDEADLKPVLAEVELYALTVDFPLEKSKSIYQIVVSKPS